MTTTLLLLVAAVLLWPAASSGAPAELLGRLSAVRHLTRTRRRGREPDGDWVAELAEVTAVGLRAGLDLRSAAEVAARSPAVRSGAPWLGPRVAQAAARGLEVSACLVDPPRRTGPDVSGDLVVLARAWRLSEHTGAAASRTTAGAAAAVRVRVAARERVAAAVAGPRASMRLLTLLPLAGPLVGVLLGLSPGALYGSAVARVSVGTGLALTVVGWWWSRGLVARAVRPGRTDGRP